MTPEEHDDGHQSRAEPSEGIMSRKEYDPLTYIPSSSTIRQRLDQTERLARRLRILLELAEKIEATTEHSNEQDTPSRELPVADEDSE